MDLNRLIENSKNGKQIDEFLDIKKCQKRPRAPKPIFWALEYEYSGNEAPKFEEYQKNGTCAP